MKLQPKRKSKTNPVTEITDALQKNKIALAQMQIQMNSFVASFKDMKPRDKRLQVIDFNTKISNFQNFFEKAATISTGNTSLRFSIDSLKQTFNVFLHKWKKFERAMNDGQV